MSDVAEQIRYLIDGCATPLGADEAIALSHARSTDVLGQPSVVTPATSWSHRRVRRLSFAGIGAALVAAVVLIALELMPGSIQREPRAAAAELHEIALNAARQSVPRLGSGQYLLTQQRVTFFADSIGTQESRSPDAQASATATIKEWANDTGGSCIEATSGPLTFSSPVSKEAWIATGLLVNPSNPTSSVCQYADTGVVDVSNLPDDPSLLARELNDGTTGISTIDQGAGGAYAGIDRAALLLIGPTIGNTATFNAALFEAMAKLPGVTDVGSVQTASGQAGVGFSVPSTPNASLLIISPSTGSLLEAKNIPDLRAYNGFGSTYVPSSLSGGISYNIVIQQIDPIGIPTVTSLPSSFTPPLPPGSAGTIVATANPGVSWQQAFDFDDNVLQQFGKAGISATISPTTHQVIMTFYFESSEQLQEYAASLRSSGSFASVDVQKGASPSGTTGDG